MITLDAARGATTGWTTCRRASMLGLAGCALIPGGAHAQPLLPRSTVQWVAGVATEARTPLGAPPHIPFAEVTEPYPGTRRAAEIHRVPEFTHEIFGWVALARVLWSSSYDQLTHSPTRWPRTSESYGRRFSTRSAQLVTAEVVRHALAAALDRDPSYVPCACTEFDARVVHVTKAVVTDFDENGVRRVAWPRFAAALAGSVMLGQLQPDQGSAGRVAYRAVTSVASSFVGNAVAELGLFRSPRKAERKRGSPDML